MTGGRGGGNPGPRQEIGPDETSPRHPPHVSQNEQGAPVQESTDAARDTPVLPANASGKDAMEPDTTSEIDEASMYDRRPGEDKDRRETDMP
jgi:hypothetical protein